MCMLAAGYIKLARTNLDVDNPGCTLKLKFGGTEIKASISEDGRENTMTKTINYFKKEHQ